MWAGSDSSESIYKKKPSNLNMLRYCYFYCLIYSKFVGTWRVGGVLAVSRAFGDKLLKQYVVADPEIKVRRVLLFSYGLPR